MRLVAYIALTEEFFANEERLRIFLTESQENSILTAHFFTIVPQPQRQTLLLDILILGPTLAPSSSSGHYSRLLVEYLTQKRIFFLNVTLNVEGLF